MGNGRHDDWKESVYKGYARVVRLILRQVAPEKDPRFGQEVDLIFRRYRSLSDGNAVAVMTALGEVIRIPTTAAWYAH